MGGRRWLLPGDVRVYQPDALAAMGPVDCVFAHLWLGRACGEMDEPPLVEDFCRFFAAARPRKVIITHMNDYSLVARDLWTQRHADLVRRRWEMLVSEAPMMVPDVGEGVVL